MQLNDLLTELKKLNLPTDQYVIYGSGPLAIRNIREARDLDVIVKESLYKRFSKQYKETKPGQIEIGKIEIYAPWNSYFGNPKEVADLINRAEIIEGFNFVRLKDLLIWKQKMGRKKDFEDIKLIKKYLQSKENKTSNQIEVFLFKKSSEKRILFLVLKRIPEKGGFWQPVTGNVRKGETFEAAAKRETEEETGISKGKLINTSYSFDFFEKGRKFYERVFGMGVNGENLIRLSREHTEFKWVTKDEALNKYLKWPGNKEGLKELCKRLKV